MCIEKLSRVRRILIVQLGTVREVTETIPLLTTLKMRSPHIEIAWLADEKSAAVLMDHWGLARLVLAPSGWHQSLRTIQTIRRRLRLFAPEVAVVPQNTVRSAFAGWLSGAKYRIGFRHRNHLAGRFLNVLVKTGTEHPIEQNLTLLHPFGIVGGSVGYDMPEYGIDRRTAKTILAQKRITGNFALLHIGGSVMSARWQPENFGLTAKYLLEQWNLPSLFVWSAFELDLAETAAWHSKESGITAPFTTLAEKTSLARRATVFIGGDTPELHLAAAAGTPCIGLFGAGAGLYGTQHRSVRGGMTTISPEMVCDACDDVLAEILLTQTLPLPMPFAQPQKKAA